MISRHYSYTLGRFYQPDKINGKEDSPLSWNLYSYVQGNPMNFVDPYGLMQAWTAIPKGYGNDMPELNLANTCPKDCPFNGKVCDCPDPTTVR